MPRCYPIHRLRSPRFRDDAAATRKRSGAPALAVDRLLPGGLPTAVERLQAPPDCRRNTTENSPEDFVSTSTSHTWSLVLSRRPEKHHYPGTPV